jgi:hypothetical protein
VKAQSPSGLDLLDDGAPNLAALPAKDALAALEIELHVVREPLFEAVGIR